MVLDLVGVVGDVPGDRLAAEGEQEDDPEEDREAVVAQEAGHQAQWWVSPMTM